jgi:hypothetical protein
MNRSPYLTPDSTADDYAEQFQQLPVLTNVEIDRFCDGCGYNLRLQPVRRDPRTAVPLCRCPECGRFHAAGDLSTAGRLWLYRATRVLLLLWLMAAWGAATCFVLLQVGIVTLMFDQARLWMLFGARGVPTEAKAAVVGTAVVLSLLLGFLTSSICAVGFSHWKWWSFLIAAATWPTLAMLMVWLYMINNMRNQIDQGLPYVWLLLVANVVGGLIGIVAGRPFARTMVRALLPHSVWPVLSYLWTIDGKPAPAGEVSSAAAAR